MKIASLVVRTPPERVAPLRAEIDALPGTEVHAVLAQHEWDRMRANDSRECRNCHAYTYMDYSKQARRAND